MGRQGVLACLLFLALTSELGSVADAAAIGKPAKGMTAKVFKAIANMEEMVEESVSPALKNVKRSMKRRSQRGTEMVSYHHLAEMQKLKGWANTLFTKSSAADLEEGVDLFDENLNPEADWHPDYKKMRAEQAESTVDSGGHGSAKLSEGEQEIKDKADAVALKKRKTKGYFFIFLCAIICFISGAIGYAMENMYQQKLQEKWKEAYGTKCEPDTLVEGHPRWLCPKEMTFGEFSSGGDAANLAIIPIVSGMASGLVFGFIDNAGLFFGMTYLDDLLPKKMPTMLGGTGKNNENVYAGMGNTFSDMVGAFLGTFMGRMVQISPSIEYDGGYPPFAEAFGVFFGCVLGVLIPHIIQGDVDKKEAIAAEKLAREIISKANEEKLDRAIDAFQLLDCPAKDDPMFGKDPDCNKDGKPIEGSGDPEKPGKVNTNQLVEATSDEFNARFIKADKIGSNDGYVSKAEMMNIMSLEYLELACYGVLNLEDKMAEEFKPFIGDDVKGTDRTECLAKAYDTVFG